MQHITVVPYDPAWPGLYEAEAQAIAGVLGQRLTAIHHIGSTAVPGLAAKPVIDIMPVVRAVTETDECRADFEALGYEYLGEFGIPGRRYLRKGGDERTHQMHIFASDDVHAIARHLAVRDYLRAMWRAPRVRSPKSASGTSRIPAAEARRSPPPVRTWNWRPGSLMTSTATATARTPLLGRWNGAPPVI